MKRAFEPSNDPSDHLSYYTALSRSSTAEGTVVIQGFNLSKITCGASGYLRQEFRVGIGLCNLSHGFQID